MLVLSEKDLKPAMSSFLIFMGRTSGQIIILREVKNNHLSNRQGRQSPAAGFDAGRHVACSSLAMNITRSGSAGIQ
jgi:hypothetical protein